MSRKKSVLIAGSLLATLILCVCFLRQCNRSEDERFEEYTQALFCEEVSGSTISLHYTLENPETYGVDDTPISLGSVTTDTKSMCASAENALAVLHSYERSYLSDENRLIYDLLEDSFSTSYELAKYALYEEPLAPLTGTQAQLPILLSEFQFSSTEDVEIYLELLKEMPEYFQSIADFEKAKSKQGLFMTSERADAVIEECETFINMKKENYLYSSFESRVLSLGLSENESTHYIEQNSICLEEYIFPAYELLADALLELRDTSKNEYGLCHLPEGQEYYELLAASETGSDRTIAELETLTLEQITQDLVDMQAALESVPITEAEELAANSDMWSGQGILFEDSNPSALLANLETKLSGDFPAPPDVNIDVKYVEESMQEYLSPAFYLIPTIDNTTDNVIYINPGHVTDDLSLFTTLAHEGYPGHLYQTTYFASLDPAPIRSLLGYGGYTEGWATYCEMISYYYAPMEKNEATLLQKNASIMLGLYALADMGIHYDGWTLTDTIDFFAGYGIKDANALAEMYELILGDPGNYLKYYIGYVEFLELKKYAIEEWDDEFTQERFHKAVLDVGPAPFEVVKEQLGTWHF